MALNQITKTILEHVRNHNINDMRQYILSVNTNINNINDNNLYLQKQLVEYVVQNTISLPQFMEVIDTFIQLGLDVANLNNLHGYFITAIENLQYQMVRYLIVISGTHFLEYVADYRYQIYDFFESIFYYAIKTGDVKMINIFIQNNVNVNYPIQYGSEILFPLCIAVYFNQPKIFAYFIDLGATMDIQRCNRGSGTFMLIPPISFEQYIELQKNDEINNIIKQYEINKWKHELTLQRVVYLNLIINETKLENIPGYMKYENYKWLLATDNPTPIVIQAKKKISSYIPGQKREREE